MVRNCIVIYFLLFFALPALALETDQYLSWQVELQDSRPAVNDYVNSKMLAKLERSSVQQANSCHLAARRIIRVFRRPFFQIIEQWAETSPAVEVYPSRNFAGSYRNESIYIKNVFPFILPMARTMNINGVYLGTDKLGHFISFGVRYFGIFHRAIERGADERTAMERVVQFGLMSEVDLVGKIVTGVLSFADLEANFQGMLFFRSLCDEKSSFHLEKNSSQQWRLVGKFDIARYVNGDWDESYNESGFSRARFLLALLKDLNTTKPISRKVLVSR
ncbi:MAG: hypothetical protein HYV97_02405 [Bdellovibrio sp.]|nr:hypothetical protein [Bdellovibrio sp.]